LNQPFIRAKRDDKVSFRDERGPQTGRRHATLGPGARRNGATAPAQPSGEDRDHRRVGRGGRLRVAEIRA